MALHVHWTTQGGGRVLHPQIFHSPTFLSDLILESIPSNTIIKGAAYLLSSKIWGDDIDLRRLNEILNDDYYRGPFGQARLARDRSVAIGRFLSDRAIWGPKEEKTINERFGWPTKSQLPIYWCQKFYLTALAQHQQFEVRFRGEIGFREFSTRYFPKSVAKAKAFAKFMMTREKRELLMW
jgi:hypothetical protein